VETIVRDILAGRAKLATAPGALGVEDDLFDRGLTSLMTVDVMLALEERFDVEFPDEALNRATFRTVAALRDLLLRLGAKA
jgi:acyl carrier protein